jgi:hypothetical protein
MAACKPWFLTTMAKSWLTRPFLAIKTSHPSDEAHGTAVKSEWSFTTAWLRLPTSPDDARQRIAGVVGGRHYSMVSLSWPHSTFSQQQ